MNRVGLCCDELYSGVPRASGDEPPASVLSVSVLVCSPRERG